MPGNNSWVTQEPAAGLRSRGGVLGKELGGSWGHGAPYQGDSEITSHIADCPLRWGLRKTLAWLRGQKWNQRAEQRSLRSRLLFSAHT